MAIRITRHAKNSLIVESPVMNAAGTLGFGDEYSDLIDLSTLGAFVTNPLTYSQWNPATGTRVVPLDGGVLVHTGLPNPGISRVIEEQRGVWERLSIPVIAHVVVSHKVDELQRCVSIVEREPSIAAVEFGLKDEINPAETEWYLRAASDRMEKPMLARLPFGASLDHYSAAVDAGAHALVVCAPPRGTARDQAGHLVAGRIYGPLVKPIVLRMVGQLARRYSHTPLIGAGGIHSPQDARDYLEAGAAAVQVDSVTWAMPGMLEAIARDLSGMETTQTGGGGLEDLFGESS
jgi:dihydroorotate dehydrogenase (NAD+) catalytic subunit